MEPATIGLIISLIAGAITAGLKSTDVVADAKFSNEIGNISKKIAAKLDSGQINALIDKYGLHSPKFKSAITNLAYNDPLTQNLIDRVNNIIAHQSESHEKRKADYNYETADIKQQITDVDAKLQAAYTKLNSLRGNTYAANLQQQSDAIHQVDDEVNKLIGQRDALVAKLNNVGQSFKAANDAVTAQQAQLNLNLKPEGWK